MADRYALPLEKKSITIRESNTRRILGAAVSNEEIAGCLGWLGFTIREKTDETVTVDVPSHRLDIAEEIDLIEEVARVYGYDRIGTGWDFRCTTYGQPDEFDQFVEGIADYLAARGFTEVIGSAFTDGRELVDFGWAPEDPRSKPIALRNPLNANHRYMRTSLVPGLLDIVRRNMDYGSKRLRFYQIGPVFLAAEGAPQLPDERVTLTLAMSEPQGADFWLNSKDH